LNACVRSEDTVARLGGDEFLVLLEQIGQHSDAPLVAGKLLAALAPPVAVAGRDLITSASIGISVYPFDADNPGDLVRAADTAMYAAKEHGRHRYAYYAPEMTEKTSKYLTLEQELRQGFHRGDLVLFYQPQVALDSGRLLGVEALIRWRHPERGLLGANEIIPVAEESGLIVEIGEWVLAEACEQAQHWLAAGLAPLRISVNASARQMCHSQFPERVAKVLAQTGLTPAHLEIEITESTLQHGDACVATLREIKRLGVSLAIDDFGTGYSCLSSLKHLPIHRCKIDRAFVHNIQDDPNDQAIAAAIIAMSHKLSLQVVAEGVETAGQAARLLALGCDEAQGYYFSHPVAPAVIAELMKKPALPS
jgi:EAL domain-containing protein (putative c-di-GMP-specific phosphodiesterase class I)